MYRMFLCSFTWDHELPQRLCGFSGGACFRKSRGTSGVRSLPRESLDFDLVESSYMAPLYSSNDAKKCSGPPNDGTGE